MGVIRILLAISVFCGHSRALGGLHWLPGSLAVELFFVISGFYMQLVLSTRYTRARLGSAWIGQFYKARYFRLLPVYIAGVALVIAATSFRPHTAPLQTWAEVAALSNSFGNVLFKAYLALTNVAILFQDAVMFLAAHDGQVHWTGDFMDTELRLWTGLAVPPAWSLGVELSFYLIAPLVLNLRSRWIVVLALASLAVKLFALKAFHLSPAWGYRFFPFELCYFLFGALACRHRHLLDRFIPLSTARICAYIFAVAITMLYVRLPLPTVLYPLALALALPTVFRATAKSTADKWIGELSYPFYIFHFISIATAGSIVRHWLHAPEQLVAWAALALTLALSVIALVLEMRWLEPWRARFHAPAGRHTAAISPSASLVQTDR